jgi:riboflavin kinase/FMN adenylyltransferase
MKIIRSLNEVVCDGNSVVTVGSFDGVHLAHQEIVREVVNRARMKESRSVIVTFDPHPKEVVASFDKPVYLLSTIEERRALLGGLHIDILYIINFTYEFSRLSSREFYEQYIVRGIGASEVVVGYDHMFGRDREAGIEELVRMGQEFNFSVFAVHPYKIDGEAVSSSMIRRAISAGNIDLAQRLLGYPYAITGSVVPGDGRGKTLGYPTANIKPHSDKKVLPGNGVYLVGVQVLQREFFGMMNIGTRPTVTPGDERTLEVHIFDLAEELRGETVTVTFLKRLRDEQKFASITELIEQLGRDKEHSMKHIADFVKRS